MGFVSGVGDSAGLGVATAAAIAIGIIPGVGDSAGVGVASGIGTTAGTTVGLASGLGVATAVGSTVANSIGAAAGFGTATSAGAATGIIASVGGAAGLGVATAVNVPVWPAGLPQLPLVNEWKWKPQNNRIAFKPEVGPDIERRRGTAKTTVFEGKFPPLTDVQVDVFEAFHDDSLDDGVRSYEWIDPMTRAVYLWRISAYQISSTAHGKFDLAVTLSRFGAAV